MTAAATPALPLPPIPLPALSTGHSTDWAAPAVQSLLNEVRAAVKILVVPEPSERWTTVMGAAGRASFRPGLVLRIAGSFQVLTLPLYMSTRVWRSRISFGRGAAVGVGVPAPAVEAGALNLTL